jgi:hypothetical protein
MCDSGFLVPAGERSAKYPDKLYTRFGKKFSADVQWTCNEILLNFYSDFIKFWLEG